MCVCHLQLSHVGYIPALAYVAAGKTQKRHLLLGKTCYVLLYVTIVSDVVESVALL